MDKKRIEYMDILKGISIITVVMGHASVASGFVFLFNMQLFFFVSGYFYNDKYIETPNVVIKKRLKTLYLPFIKYGVVFLILHDLFYNINFYSKLANVPESFYTLKDIANKFIHILLFDSSELLLSPFWFLTDLFIITMLFTLIFKITNNLKSKDIIRIIIIIALFVIGNYLTKIGCNLSWSIYNKEMFNVSFVGLLFFYAGHFYKKYESKVKFNVIFAGISGLLLIAFWHFKLSGDMRINHYPNIPMSIITSLVGIYFMIYLCKKIEKVKAKEILKYLGQNTITILALHITCFKIVGLLQIKFYKLPIYNLGNFPIINKGILFKFLCVVVGIAIPILIQYTIFDKFKMRKINKEQTLGV